MQLKTVDLYEYFGVARVKDAKGYLKVMALEKAYDGVKKVRPAMVVFGGGAYQFISEREQEPVALEYLARGYSAFVLDYSVNSVSFPAQLLEACMSIAYIRENADELGVSPNQICAVGFSAGGHLCGSLATLYNEQIVKDTLGKKAKLTRPDAVILSYPVIDGGEHAHRLSFDILSGGDERLVKDLSLQNRVTADSVPAFIWATANDACVPCENSLIMALAYKKAGVPFELHIYEEGQHGLSTCTVETATSNDDKNLINPHDGTWVELSLQWLKNRGFGTIVE